MCVEFPFPRHVVPPRRGYYVPTPPTWGGEPFYFHLLDVRGTNAWVRSLFTENLCPVPIRISPSLVEGAGGRGHREVAAGGGMGGSFASASRVDPIALSRKY